MTIECYAQAQSTYPLVVMEGTPCKIDDIFSSDDSTAPISAGLFEVAAGGSLTYTYKYHELKIMLEGEFDLEDKATGAVVHAKAGDVIKIAKGTTVVFSSPSFGKAFYCGQRALRDF